MVWVGDREPPDLGPHVQVYDAAGRLRDTERDWQEQHAGADPAAAWSEA